ncbi:MAG: tetratricopeptide repeat protein [Hamadaea sp.]|nr:tetratricopeptide repeat protein [Hamadaea sp.]
MAELQAMLLRLVIALVGAVVMVGVIVAVATVIDRLWRRTPAERLLARIPEYQQAIAKIAAEEFADALDLAWRAYERCQALVAGRPRGRTALACAETVLGSALTQVGRYDEALAYLVPASEHLRDAGERDGGDRWTLELTCLLSLSEAQRSLGEHREALRSSERAVRLHIVHHGVRRTRSKLYRWSLLHHGRVLVADNRLADATDAVKDTLILARTERHRDDQLAAACLVTLAEIGAKTGSPQLTLPLAEQAVTELRALAIDAVHHRDMLAEALVVAADLFYRVGRSDDAERAAREAGELLAGLSHELPDRFTTRLEQLRQRHPAVGPPL